MAAATSSKLVTSTRWNLVISDQTNIAVRSFLAQRGFKKGDLSSFVEEAVRWRVFDQTLAQARKGFDEADSNESQNLLDEALAQVRADGLIAGTYDAFRPVKQALAISLPKTSKTSETSKLAASSKDTKTSLPVSPSGRSGGSPKIASK